MKFYGKVKFVRLHKIIQKTKEKNYKSIAGLIERQGKAYEL